MRYRLSVLLVPLLVLFGGLSPFLVAPTIGAAPAFAEPGVARPTTPGNIRLTWDTLEVSSPSPGLTRVDSAVAVELAGWASGSANITYTWLLNGDNVDSDSDHCANTHDCLRHSKTSTQYFVGDAATLCVRVHVAQQSATQYSSDSKKICATIGVIPTIPQP